MLHSFYFCFKLIFFFVIVAAIDTMILTITLYSYWCFYLAFFNNDFFSIFFIMFSFFVGPVYESLGVFGVKGPSGLLAVYYLACNNDLKMKIDPQV